MKHIVEILFRLFVFLVFCNCTFASSLTKAELVGTYCLDASSLHGQNVPTNFYAFAITLNADDSFVATNVPADFFFGYTPTPAASEARGTWKLRHESEGSSLFYNGENDYLDLNFVTAPGPGSYGTNVEPAGSTPRIYISYHSGKKDDAVFYLKKQKRGYILIIRWRRC
jgi:hypothetical protein